ncbi:MAG: 4Fe-4S dicluster domain-containing protein, partial [Proteiniphilum sp.]
FTSFNNFTFYKVSIYILSLSSLLISLITLLVIGYLAWRNGRTWCNTICPVGTALGFISKFSLFRIRFVDEKCNMCGLCAMKCKASCIDSKNKQVDYSRCVGCFNCIESCNRNAMRYTLVRPGKKGAAGEKDGKAAPTYSYLKEDRAIDDSKRRFLSASLVTGLAAGKLAAQITSDSIFPAGTNNLLSPERASGDLLPRREFKRQTPIAPPGTPTFDHLREKCISCHLCVSKCPSHVIKPAFLEYGLGGMMQPRLYFDHGFCNYDCTICGEVCPTGAILPLTKEEKNHTQMGQVQLIIENCIVYYDETSCGACSEHCPTQAVHMVPYKGMLTIPEIRPEICVGCGGCEYVCPAIPYKAIYVEGLTLQNTVEIEHDEVEEVIIDDFGF